MTPEPRDLTERHVVMRLRDGEECLLDQEDFARLGHYVWKAYRTKRVTYARRSNGTPVQLHREILGFPVGMIDHINGNGLDNRRCNLRLATNQQNQSNAKIPSHNTSGFKGVSPGRGRYQAKLKHGEKVHWLGYFATAEDAARAYDAAAMRLRGHFAFTNFRYFE